MVKLLLSRKLIKAKKSSVKSSSASIDVIGHLMKPKAPESPTNKFLKTLVSRCSKACTAVTMLQFSHMVKQVLVSHVQSKVFLTFSPKVCSSCVCKTFSVANKQTSQKESQQQSESLTCKFTTKSLKISCQKTQKTTKYK